MLFSHLLCNHLLLISHLNILGLIALIKCGVLLAINQFVGFTEVHLALCVASLNWTLYGLHLIVGHKNLKHLMLLPLPNPNHPFPTPLTYLLKESL